VLQGFLTKVQGIKDEHQKICKAKEVLDMDPDDPEKLDALIEEITGLKEVWNELSKVW